MPSRCCTSGICWRHHQLGQRSVESQSHIFDHHGWIMRGGSIVDATIIAVPSSIAVPSLTSSPSGRRVRRDVLDEEGQAVAFGDEGHVEVDLGTGYVHAVTATSANVHIWTRRPTLVRADDEVVYADAGYQGAGGPSLPTMSTCHRWSGGSRPGRTNSRRCRSGTSTLSRVKQPSAPGLSIRP